MRLRYLSSIILTTTLLEICSGEQNIDVHLGEHCGGKFFRSCLEIPGAICGPGNKCRCKDGYVGIDGQKECYEVVIGMNCAMRNYYICDKVPNLICNHQEQRCECAEGYTGEEGTATCTEVPGYNDYRDL